MAQKTNQIIADSSALVSLITETDHNHARAVEEATHLIEDHRTIILPADVFVETINVLGKISSHQIAIKAAHALLETSSKQFILIETAAYRKAALEKFEALADAVSLTDCIVMAVADHYETKDIFGFDKQFADAGYDRLTPSTDW